MRKSRFTDAQIPAIVCANVCFCCGRSDRMGFAGPPQPTPGHRGGPAKRNCTRSHRQQASSCDVATISLSALLATCT